MRFVDVISIVSGIASIISLLISAWDRFGAWRKYIQPVAWGLAGFAAGRFSVAVMPKSPATQQDAPVTGELILFLVVLGVVSFVAFAMLRRNEPVWAYLIFSLGLFAGGPLLLKTYSEASRRIPVGDLVLLSTDKESVGDYSGAILYLERAAAATDDSGLREKLRAHKTNLESKLVDSASTKATTTPR
jgi:hypothetical protein